MTGFAPSPSASAPQGARPPQGMRPMPSVRPPQDIRPPQGMPPQGPGSRGLPSPDLAWRPEQRPGQSQLGPQPGRSGLPPHPGPAARPDHPRRPVPTPATLPGAHASLNVLAVLSIVFVVVCAPVAVVLGVVARRQAARRGERGRGLATGGIVAGAVVTVLGALLVISGAATVHAGPYLSSSEVETAITQQSEGRIQDVHCADDLYGTPGATTTCTGSVDGTPGTLRATTTGSEGGHISFDVQSVG